MDYIYILVFGYLEVAAKATVLLLYRKAHPLIPAPTHITPSPCMITMLIFPLTNIPLGMWAEE